MERSCNESMRDLPRWAYLWLALVPLGAELAARLAAGPAGLYRDIFGGERGLIENLTVLAFLWAAAAAIGSARIATAMRLGRCAPLLTVFAAACLLLAGEELSWGQHWIGWKSPQFFQEQNFQRETNLHNLSSGVRFWLWRVAWIAVVLAGALLPVWLSLKGWQRREGGHWIGSLVPTMACVPAASVQAGVHAASGLVIVTGFAPGGGRGINWNETGELYFAIFLLIYASSLYMRLRPFAKSSVRTHA